ncbi:MAG: nucleoside triphosphate pyrophosphohydrolase [Hyphomicrobiales bacterium]|nr:nucleoside triphosphate pyrophosphohydrolase [Hyphomicrobiales bacterium]MDE2018400.1 nucleoside triphosphate pyrophosphohydrolase [Hyphomicrobiales bacterium]
MTDLATRRAALDALPERPSIDRLVAIMAALRAPVGGCPWDLAQDHRSLAPYAIEEAAEVADAIERGEFDDLRDELGDLLLQVVFHAQLAREAGRFDFDAVGRAICDKLVRRHPHVFADADATDAADVKRRWDDIKAAEKAARDPSAPAGLLDGVPAGLPALMRAEALQKRAGKVGFDWKNARLAFAKVREEADEVDVALDAGGPALAEEIGDLLFTVVNVARLAGVEPEGALRAANVKFARRFGAVEAGLAARGRAPGEASLDEMEALWTAAKLAERAPLARKPAAG